MSIEDDNTFLLNDTNAQPILTFKSVPTAEQYKIIFYKEGKQVGVLDLNPDKMSFTGDADASAEAFFDCVIRYYIAHKTS